jgi:hypothetical protein
MDQEGTESNALAKTLAWVVGVIVHYECQPQQLELKRIAHSYLEAQAFIVDIPKDNGNARPRIVACIERHNAYLANHDVANIGWMLTAMQERLNEQNVPGWEKMLAAVDNLVNLVLSWSNEVQ